MDPHKDPSDEEGEEDDDECPDSLESLTSKKKNIKNTKAKDKMQAYSTQGTSKSKHRRAKTEVLGGRIVRSTGRTDRHSKVCTVRGPRDRRVRLSPNIAIQFYDVQDRLGYDRPSKAVDWLMKEAKAAIDALPVCNNAAIFKQSASDHGVHNSSRTSFFGQDYFNQTTNGAISTISTSNDFLNFSVDDHLRNKYQTQGLSLSFNSSQEFSLFGSQQSSIPELLDRGNSCSLQIIPSTFNENHLLNCHREPLQSNFSAPFSDQHHSFNYENTTFSSDGILGLSNPYTFHGEEQNQVSCKPASSTAFLQHYQE